MQFNFESMKKKITKKITRFPSNLNKIRYYATLINLMHALISKY